MRRERTKKEQKIIRKVAAGDNFQTNFQHQI